MPKHIGPTTSEGRTVVTFCTKAGAARITEFSSDEFGVEYSGVPPFRLSAEGVRALIDAFKLLDFD